jgi:hypothetical protein
MFSPDYRTPPDPEKENCVSYDGASATTEGRATPDTEVPPHSAIPWYDKTYMIKEKKTGKAIAITKDGLLHLGDGSTSTTANRWLCVSKDNHTGFWNSHSGVYLGHDGRDNQSSVHAIATKMKDYEYFFARQHPDGGYQLLSAVGSQLLYFVVSAAGEKVMRTRHGDTLWVFEEV